MKRLFFFIAVLFSFILVAKESNLGKRKNKKNKGKKKDENLEKIEFKK
jgi:hypothetical protein